MSDDEIRDRLIFALVNRGAYLLEEGVALRPGDIDIVYVYGYGFPPHRGGPMWYADEVGVQRRLRANPAIRARVRSAVDAGAAARQKLPPTAQARGHTVARHGRSDKGALVNA